MNDNSKPAPAKFKAVVLKEGLTHNGKKCAVDEEIEVSESQLAFLRKREFIAPAPGAEQAAKSAKPGKE